jgi:hypothetical protein
MNKDEVNFHLDLQATTVCEGVGCSATGPDKEHIVSTSYRQPTKQ